MFVYTMQRSGDRIRLYWIIGVILFLILVWTAINIAAATLAPCTALSYDWSADYGNVIVDGSGYNNNGTNYGSVIHTMSNGYKYRTFDTSGKYITAPGSDPLNATTITIECIFNSSNTGVHQAICLKQDYPDNGYWYGIDITGRLYFYVMNAGVDRPYLSNIYVTDGNVHDITATYDGRYMKFYDFGVLKDSKDWGDIMLIGASNSNFHVSMPAGMDPFNGNIYLLRVTGEALSSGEVAENVNMDSSRLALPGSTSTAMLTLMSTPTSGPQVPTAGFNITRKAGSHRSQ